jgi:histidinol-phosphate aminotransferase
VEALAAACGEGLLVVDEVGDGRSLRRRLLSHGLMVRDCTSFGLPEYVRIAARRMEECRRLIKTLRQLLIRDV